MATKSMTKTSVVNNNEEVTTVKKYENNDLIPCRSLVSGALYIEGARTKFLYSWADYGDIQEMEYQDLIYIVRTRGNKDIYLPRIIIEDEEFVQQNKSLSELYNSLYSMKDLRDIIKLPNNQMKEEIERLPKGAKNALKSIVSTMIDSHSLDSVQKIKTLDEIFGTQLLLTLVQE